MITSRTLRQCIIPTANKECTALAERTTLHIPRHRAPPLRVDQEKFVKLDPVDRIKAIYDAHGDKAVQLSSMQKTAGVIMHLIYRAQVNIPIVFVDTQYIHQETYDTKSAFQEKYGLDIVTIKPELSVATQDLLYGQDLYKTKIGSQQCCFLRKEKPLLDALSKMKVQATISGLMQTEKGARSDIEPVSYDPRNRTTVYHPIFDFTNQEIHAYNREHDLPVNTLYKKNFLSIGCEPCTTAVRPGENARAGRWRHLRSEGEKHVYCGMNYSDVQFDRDEKQTCSVW